MAYVKVTNGKVDTYPYNVGELRRDNPQISFPKRIPSALLAQFGVHEVLSSEPPVFSKRTQRLEQNEEPNLTNAEWFIGWAVVEKTTAEVQAYDANASHGVRVARDAYLAASDWTQVSDAPVDAIAWATYRQALRDITDHVNFPYLADEDWPVKPV